MQINSRIYIFRLAIIFLVFMKSSNSFRRVTFSHRLIHLSSSIHGGEDGKIDLLYDSECPICQMEVDFLKKRDIDNRIRYTDLSSPSYRPEDHGNVQFADGMRKIRAVLPDRTVITGVEVFRQTYKAIGLGWLVELTNMPIIGTIADSIYDLWAENRLRITGRGDLADVLKERAEMLRSLDPADCELDACALDFGDDETVGAS